MGHTFLRAQWKGFQEIGGAGWKVSNGIYRTIGLLECRVHSASRESGAACGLNERQRVEWNQFCRLQADSGGRAVRGGAGRGQVLGLSGLSLFLPKEAKK